MKVSILISYILCCSIVYLFTSCQKDCGCDSDKEITTKTISINGEKMSFRTGSNGVKFTLATNKETNVSQTIIEILEKYGLTAEQYNSPVAASFYLKDTLLQNVDLSAVHPEAFVLYDKIEDRIITKFFILKEQQYSYLDDFFAITAIFSQTDVIDMMNLNFIQANEIISLVDLNQINKSIYLSDLQLLLEKKLNDQTYLAKGGRPSSGCSEADPGCKMKNEGYCTPQERQSGPVSYYCIPKEDNKCVRTDPDKETTLEQAGETNSEAHNQRLYNIRDNVLSYSFNGKKLIDDYYYCSMILKDVAITLPMAISALKIFDSGFLKNFEQFRNPDNSNQILINSEIKNLLLDLCHKSREISDDSRYQNIITRLENQINYYENKVNYEIQNDY